MDRIAAIRRRTTNDVSPHVAATAQGAQPGGVNAADRLDQVRLPHAVNLQVLPRGQPQIAVAKLLANIQVRQQLLAGKTSAGNDRPQHEAILPLLRRAAGLAQPPPLVAVVLLIDAVLPQQRRGLVAEVVASVGQLLDNPPAETIAFQLDRFHRVEFWGCGSHGEDIGKILRWVPCPRLPWACSSALESWVPCPRLSWA